MKKIVAPSSVLIETTALELATIFYEAGRSSGLKSKHKNARLFAKHNLEKFIPKAVDLLLEILSRDTTPEDQKKIIFEALMERHNDPELNEVLPNLDVKKLIEINKAMQRDKTQPVIIQSIEKKTILHR